VKNPEIIREWYKKNRRELPWRSTTDPYSIWLSEVILQQTRIIQGISYYLRFLEAFPDVRSLAAAGDQQVLKLWEGLGYYSRARNLHMAAREVVERLEGEIPRTYDELLRLKGVGTYTAAAIASICFNEPKAVVDGNVARVISRIHGVMDAVNSTSGSRIIARLADEMLDRSDPGIHNQAMMEFGALQCIPIKPDCEGCPLRAGCIAYASGLVDLLPVKKRGKKPVKIWMYFYIIRCGGELILTRRGNGDIWGGLYQSPLEESKSELEESEIIRNVGTRIFNQIAEDSPVYARNAPDQGNRQYTIEHISAAVRHQLTHRNLLARFIHVSIGKWPDPLPDGWVKISFDQMGDFPVPRLINRYMEVVRNSYL
jgi:A/G-specific adenine glycosylase